MVVITQNVLGTEEITETFKPSIHYQVPQLALNTKLAFQSDWNSCNELFK